MHSAPRPGYAACRRSYHLGLPLPIGWRWLAGPSCYERPRRRSRFALTAGTLHYLACRRITAAKCQKMGMRRLRPGVWYSDLADVLYAQAMAPAGHEWDWGV